MEWYKINLKKEEKTAEILIYEQIGEDFWGEGVSAKRFVEELNDLDVDYIQLRINSPGGNVFDGNAIYNNLKAHRATVNVKIDGIAASIASVIAMAGDNIEMPQNAMIMVHNPSALVMGSAEDMVKMANTLDRIKDGIVLAYQDKTKMDGKKIASMMDAETWLTAEEARENGFADTITEKVKVQANYELLKRFKNVPKVLFESKMDDQAIDQNNNLKEGEIKMQITIQLIKDEHPDIWKAIFDEGVALGKEEGLTEGKEFGAKEELARIKGVSEQVIPGHEDLIVTLMYDGKTSGPEAAIQVLAAEKAVRNKKGSDLLDDGSDVKVDDAGALPDPNLKDKVDPNLPLEERCKQIWEKDPSVRNEYADDYDSFVAYEKAVAAGRVRVLKNRQK